MKKFIVFLSLVVAPVLASASALQNFTIEAQGQDQYLSYNFGSVFENSRTSVDFTLTANGPEPTEVKKIWISGPMYDATSNCPEILPVGKKCVTRVYYWPLNQGPHWGDLTFVLNDGNIYIRLFGTTFPR